MANGGRRINSVTLYSCGTCRNNAASVFRGEKKREIVFPALVCRIEHAEYGNILFDTGYSDRIFKNGFVSKIYNRLNPASVREEDTIRYKMKAEGCKIGYIILSHAHPDHIGCLKDFEDYKLLATRDCLKSFEKAGIRDLVFKNQVPDRSEKVDAVCLEPMAPSYYDNDSTAKMLSGSFKEIYNIFGDGSVFGIRLDGHSKGQLGVYIPEFSLFLAADASWGHYFADRVDQMRFIPRRIQNNFKEYKDTILRIKHFEKLNPDIKVIYSHEEFPEGIYGQ